MLQARLSRVQVVGTPGKAFDNKKRLSTVWRSCFHPFRTVLRLGIETSAFELGSTVSETYE